MLGVRLLAVQAAGQLPAALEQALAKLRLVLPRTTRLQAESQTGELQFLVPRACLDLDEPRLAILRRALIEQRVVAIHYHSYSANEVTQREIEPHQLTYSDATWYVTGYYRLRQAIRSFRLDRVDELRLRPTTFIPFEPVAPVVEPVQVTVRFAPDILRWVHERQHYGFTHANPDHNGEDHVLHYLVRHLREITPWLRSWGPMAEVLSPVELRRQLRDEASRLVELLA